MYTEKMRFINNEIEKKLELEIQKNANLIKIIDEVLKEFNDNKMIVLCDIMNENGNYDIILNVDNIPLKVNINLDSLLLSCEINENDIIALKNITQELDVLDGVTYKCGNRMVSYTSEDSLASNFNFVNKDKAFDISLINKNKYVNYLNIRHVIMVLLNSEYVINDIRDVYNAITDVVSTPDTILDIKSNDGESVIHFENGNILKYVNVKKFGNYMEKMYLKDNKYYVERTRTEELIEDNIPHIKKLGGRNE